VDRKYFVLYLIPSRPEFAQTMSDEERGIMTRHVAYWKEWLDKGVAEPTESELSVWKPKNNCNL